ncbi:MAG TPA: STAS domain-containing protein [Pyrinomonadaceae bacterium]|jgi:anti-sigma B factor antagonist
MFTRRVIMNIKPGAAAEAGRILEGEVIPPLRKQRGMRHDGTFISPALSEVVLNSYWDARECAESYGRTTYPAALKALSKVLEGTPRVETFDISSSTFHLLTAPRREAYRTSELGKGVGPSAPLSRHTRPVQEDAAAVNRGVNERRNGAVTILDLDGELRAGGSRVQLHDAVERLSGVGRNQILLNLAGLSGIDAGGLGELLQSGVELNRGGGQLKLLHPARALLAMISITKLVSVFDCFESESEAVAAFAEPTLGNGWQPPPASTHATKRILEIGVYKPGELTSEVTTLDDVDVRAEGDTALFTGHATVKSRFKGRDFGSLYRLSKRYEKRQGRWRMIASKTARLGDE